MQKKLIVQRVGRDVVAENPSMTAEHDARFTRDRRIGLRAPLPLQTTSRELM